MRRIRRSTLIASVVATWCFTGVAFAQAVFPKPTDIPTERTGWIPEGCRQVYSDNPVFAPRTAFRNIHADEINTDAVSVALATSFERGEVFADDPTTWHFSGPMFDDDGNLYYSAVDPFDGNLLVSLTPDGTQRWAIPATGAPQGPSGPYVLDDPEHPGDQIVYVGVYDRAIAVRTDGTVIWDVPTGLASENAQYTFGINYQPQNDALVVNTLDGLLYALDRKTGAQLLDEPFSLPGSPSPFIPVNQPPALLQCVFEKFSSFVNTDAAGVQQIFALLLGNSVEVANFFSIEPRSGRLFVPATAPDEADGTEDGVSELGALYALELVERDGGGLEMEEICRLEFPGGSASTPALNPDGTRVYFGDNFGSLIAMNPDCTIAWTLDIGDQIFGSIAVAADNNELYASFDSGIVKVVDEGDQGRLAWRANFDLFAGAPGVPVVTRNTNLVSLGANAMYFQAGGSVVTGVGEPLIVTMGVGALDRDSGEVIYFEGGLEETIAVMSTGPDGVLHLGASPARRPFALCASELGLLPFPVPPLEGGIVRWEPLRRDIMTRDGVCAVADRVLNDAEVANMCVESVEADITQVRELLEQAYENAKRAIDSGDLKRRTWLRAKKHAIKGAFWLGVWKLFNRFTDATFALERAAWSFDEACERLDRAIE